MNQAYILESFLYKLLILLIGAVLLILHGCATTREASPHPTIESTNIASSTPSIKSSTHTSTQAIKITPTPELQSLFLYTRAVQSLQAEEYNDAVNAFTMVIKRMPDLAIAYKGRAAAYYGSKRIGLAEEDLIKALDINMNLGGAYLYLGLIHRDKGSMEEAEVNLLKAVNLIHKVRENSEFNKAQKALRELGSR